ncbi:protein serine/threonine phosphatase with GAF(s) sensor(s) [[Leptolyngbya] sp. PCC 7376]|uniref:SpoIIE family protein phosphatase n=1 Tax=[Leptolyngbya] sp. PCC 7376 TaxID=111781 RepID=UPI00029EFAB8|nr:SpoIIE family protein phosphatase [[Leptolyngbya] sp. PCC 7376]AFY37770.1 protein serine/threonine phosphatase with GAF(s) sensor(s) [[Leptolyngbya] sp. PCC 7376]
MSVANTNKLKLMVVDDETDNLDLLYRTFRREFRVYRAASAPEALDILASEGEMAIIISDQRMPVMNGTEFLSRTVEAYPNTIRILLTGYTDVEDLVGAINSGKVFKYITKPWKPDALMSTIHQAADTYKVLKQRTNQLERSLRQEELVNSLIRAIRESLDYESTLQTIVERLSESFHAEYGVLYPVTEGQPQQLSAEKFSHPQTSSPLVEHVELAEKALQKGDRQLEQCVHDQSWLQLAVPLIWKQKTYAILTFWHNIEDQAWSEGDLQLLDAVLEQSALAIAQAKLYQKIQQQTEQIRNELEVARQIQHNLLPQASPELDNAKIQGYCLPARQVGGDFFETYHHSNGDLWLAVGDVSGKGVPAALFMASALSTLRQQLNQTTPASPKEIIQHLNRVMADDLFNSNCFITMVIACYQPEHHKLTYANAGHIYPMLWSHHQPSSDSQPTYLKTRGIPIGILPEWQAEVEELTLKSRDVLLITSDGITEATVTKPELLQERNDMLNQEGLWRLILQNPERFDLYELLDRFNESTYTEQEDDQTIVSLEVM